MLLLPGRHRRRRTYSLNTWGILKDLWIRNNNFNISLTLSFIGLAFFVVKLIQHNWPFSRSGYSTPNIWTLRDGWGTGEGREGVPNFHHRLDSQYLFQLVKRFYIKNVSVGLSLHKIGVICVAPIKYQCTKLSYINMKIFRNILLPLFMSKPLLCNPI